jgi:hypothetical protein
MPSLLPTIRFLVAAVLAMALTACTSFVPETGAKIRALDYLNDDIAAMIVALDLPAGIAPVPEASTLHFDFVSPTAGEKHVAAALALTDPGELAGTLPPPGNGRAYYLLGFSEGDKSALRDAQAWARALPAGSVNTGAKLPISVAPRFCATEVVDVSRATYSVLVALPGTARLEPLVLGQPIAATLEGGVLAAC